MKYRRILSTFLICCLIISSSFVFVNSDGKDIDVYSEENNTVNSSTSYIDSISVGVRTNIDPGMSEVANGNSDVFLWSTDGLAYESIDESWKEELGRWKAETGYNEIFFNSAHTVSPYEVKTDDGEIKFNPFAIQKIRYAANFLINRSKVVKQFYKGHAEPRYTAISCSSPAYEDHFEEIVEKRGFTVEGNEEKGKEMVREAMFSAMNDSALKGELKPPSDSSDYWQYKPPNGDFESIEVSGIIRIEDRREEIGDYFSDLLEECGIKVYRIKPDAVSHGAIVWSSDPADLRWHFYTGGWLSNTARYYQEHLLAEMYSGWWGFMPGGFVPDPDYKYGYEINGEFYGNRTLEEITKMLDEGQVKTEKKYWEFMEKAVDIGTEEAVRVFVCSNSEYYIHNKDDVKSATTDVISGWSDYFTPRTVKTTDGELTADVYSAQGTLYMDFWNEIAGTDDKGDIRLKRMSMDPGAALHPKNGKPIPMRCNWYNEEDWYKVDNPKSMVERDYQWAENETGVMKLEKNLQVPEDAVDYNTTTEKWEEVGPNTRSAVKVTYKVNTGKWHDGHDLTIKDLMANYAFMKELGYKDSTDDKWYYEHFYAKDWYETIVATEWNGENQTYTIWGDYTSPFDSRIGKYYTKYIFPVVPHQLYEAAQFLVNQDYEAEKYIPDDVERYRWDDRINEGINWLSESQGKDFKATLQNMKGEYVPPYLKEENDAPITIDQTTIDGQIDHIIDFYNKYEHMFTSTGPFMIEEIDQSKTTMNYTRFTKEEGYPFGVEYWEDILRIPKADAGEDRTIVPGEVVIFNGTGSLGYGSIESYIWTIGGEQEEGQYVTYKFEEYGEYTVKLNVTDIYGNHLTDTVTITVKDMTKPTAVAKCSQEGVTKIGEEISFNGSECSDNVGIEEYIWSFGDGTNATGEDVTHSYDEPGEYNVTLTVIDEDGNKDTDQITIDVEEEEEDKLPWIPIVFIIMMIGVSLLSIYWYRGRRVKRNY